MFDGSFKARRTINLGGNKQQVDKQRLLRQAQEERRLREAERLRQKSAERIQAWYRGRTVARTVRQDLRQAWDQETLALETSIRSGDTSLVQECDGAHASVRTFLIFFRPAVDHKRLVRLCSLLVMPSGSKKITLFAKPFQLEQDKPSSWILLLKRAIPKISEYLGTHANWEENEADQVVTFLDTISSSESFLTAVEAAPATELSQAFVDSRIIPDISLFVNRTPVEDKDRPSVARALLLSTRICRSSYTKDGNAGALDQFVTRILTLPLLPNRVSLATLTAFTTRLPLDAILQHLASTACSSVAQLPQNKVIPLMANILAFGYQRVAKMSTAVSNAYLQVLTCLLGLIPVDSIEAPAKPQRDEDNDDLDDLEWRTEELPGSPSKSPRNTSSNTALDSRVMKWLSLAHDNSHLNDILGSIVPASSTKDDPSDILSTAAIGDITLFLLNLITLFPSHKINILSNLMYFKFGSTGRKSSASTQSGGKFFGISIIKIFLDAFMSTQLYQQLLQSMQQDTPLSVQLVLDPGHAKAWNLLAFVSELYCQILVTMGDDEFHDDSKNPISLSSVITLSSIVRDIAFLLWWNDNALNMDSNIGGSKNLKVGYLRDIVTKLTRQLHARDSRRPYCPKDHWLLSMPLDMMAFQQAVIQDEQNLSQDQDQDDNEQDGDSLMGGLGEVRMRRNTNRRQRSSQLARLSPRLGVLNNIPFVIRFEDRVTIFRSFVESDRKRTTGVTGYHPQAVGVANIQRGSVFEDGFEQLNHLGSKLKGRIAISFIDQYGIPEAGIDGGGVFKEFLTSLVLQAFDTNYGLFMNTSEQLLYPNPHGFAQEKTQLRHYEFLGRILGKALYEGILIDAAFAGFFLSKCLGQVNYLDDLPSLDPELYKGLMFLKNYEGNVEDLSLYFTVDDEEMGTTLTRELVPNGSNTLVTKQNRIRYIYLTAHYRLNTQIDRQCRAFFRGLSDLIDPKWLWMFNQHELQVMLGGAQTGISLTDLAKNVVYSNFVETDPTIQYFWSVVQEMTEEDRRLLIKFITSCARPPLLGFKELNPKLCIRNAGQEEDRLPTSSTCMNLLKLPAFTSRQRLKDKLMYAIHSEAGFDLS
ncbi:ubiquitin-protein ligase E3 C [Entomortierella parvispora]|uniref:HECT-type E3 ubiquitin transferase n=1 Tax=Entomortierella parvispora TaxID=205924 RepID=A0A9P3M0P7_9FUNG|nr:ubiquitin-protein ligase E3 C [Entomortierella parvispora]